MPLTDKGEEIMRNMKSEYGAKKGKEVFYASANKGTIKGVHGASEHSKAAYAAGFINACTDAGVDPDELAKQAAPIAQLLQQGAAALGKGTGAVAQVAGSGLNSAKQMLKSYLRAMTGSREDQLRKALARVQSGQPGVSDPRHALNVSALSDSVAGARANKLHARYGTGIGAGVLAAGMSGKE